MHTITNRIINSVQYLSGIIIFHSFPYFFHIFSNSFKMLYFLDSFITSITNLSIFTFI